MLLIPQGIYCHKSITKTMYYTFYLSSKIMTAKMVSFAQFIIWATYKHVFKMFTVILAIDCNFLIHRNDVLYLNRVFRVYQKARHMLWKVKINLIKHFCYSWAEYIIYFLFAWKCIEKEPIPTFSSVMSFMLLNNWLLLFKAISGLGTKVKTSKISNNEKKISGSIHWSYLQWYLWEDASTLDPNGPPLID